MEIRNIQVGDRFVKWDGRTCQLIELNDCRARIVVYGLSKIVEIDERFGTKRETSYNGTFNVSPGTEVLRVLSGEEFEQQTTSDRADSNRKEIFMPTKNARKTPELPDKFTREYNGAVHTMEKSGDGWSLDGGSKVTLKEAMISLLTLAKVDLSYHWSAATFFHRTKIRIPGQESESKAEKKPKKTPKVKAAKKAAKTTKVSKRKSKNGSVKERRYENGKVAEVVVHKPGASLPFSKEKQLGK